MGDQPLHQSLNRIKAAGYDGVEFGCELNDDCKETFLSICKELGLRIIMQQYAATGKSFDEYKENYKSATDELSKKPKDEVKNTCATSLAGNY